ncbi:hypothetical protein AYO47_06215 [Planctomyces sp. SCGC AG-212-M04]|nr:hypothetical protein AYO47_06215 [Planctomyces sp. SCGC AG-212-M04]
MILKEQQGMPLAVLDSMPDEGPGTKIWDALVYRRHRHAAFGLICDLFEYYDVIENTRDEKETLGEKVEVVLAEWKADLLHVLDDDEVWLAEWLRYFREDRPTFRGMAQVWALAQCSDG